MGNNYTIIGSHKKLLTAGLIHKLIIKTFTYVRYWTAHF
jgi:hypothetical protein